MSGLDDLGFVDVEGAKGAVCRIRCRAHLQSLAVRLGELPRDRLHHGIDPDSNTVTALMQRAIGLALGNLERRVDESGVDLSARYQASEQQLLDSSDVILHLVEALLELLVHGEFSDPVPNEGEASERAESGHRLSHGLPQTLPELVTLIEQVTARQHAVSIRRQMR